MDADTSEIKAEFDLIDKKDAVSLRSWFEKYPFLSTNDIAMIVGLGAPKIRKLRRLAGFRENIKQPRYVRVPEIIDVPENWNTKEWLTEAVSKYGVPSIAKAVGRNYSTIYDKVWKWKIPKRSWLESVKSKNPCCTSEWLTEHYVERQLSAVVCSKLAGVSRDTIINWLVRFGIQVRTNDPMVGKDSSRPSCDVSNNSQG